MTTNVLVIGSGAREHALVWKLRQSPRVGDLFVAPGNPGTESIAVNIPIDPMDFDGLEAAIRLRGIGLIVVGPEAPLAAGLTDYLGRTDVPVFGPTKAAARIESSKSFAKQLMREGCIPTAAATSFVDYDEAVAFAKTSREPPVVKADGLAAGKGVTVPSSLDEALSAIHAAMVARAFGDAGRTILLEERLRGREVSAHAFCDGSIAVPMPYACDHKSVFDGGMGPNTGGMGAFSPPSFVGDSLHTTIWREIVQPALSSLSSCGAPYRGVLYPGLMITDEGPRVVEFNCRFGDPETQVLLPRLRSDLFEALLGSATGRLRDVSFAWSPDACVGVVLATEGYPLQVRTGDVITGVDDVDEDVLVFQAGTVRDSQGRLRSAGGRVLTVVALGATLEAARQRAYANVQRLHFRGVHFRTDIGQESG